MIEETAALNVIILIFSLFFKLFEIIVFVFLLFFLLQQDENWETGVICLARPQDDRVDNVSVYETSKYQTSKSDITLLIELIM